MWSEIFLLDQTGKTMANFKVAVFIALIVFLSQTAYSISAPNCEDDCYAKSYFCRLGCSDQTCANSCSGQLAACYKNCGLKAKRESNRPFSRDASEKKGFYDGFQK
ncbi:hypothetical protein ACROYT_G018476 [Oculina patagonica]